MIRSPLVVRLALFVPMLLLALVAFSGAGGAPAWATPAAPQLVFEPATLTVDDAPAALAVRVEGASDLYAIELDVLFDADVVAVASIEPGDFLSADFVAEQAIDEASGTASLAYTQIDPSQPQDGSGTVALLTLRPEECAGTTSLHLSNVVLSDRDGNSIAHDVETGTVHCGAAGASTPQIYLPLVAGD